MIPNYADHSANERTFLAWIRTAVSIMAFGFLVEKFELFLDSKTLQTGEVKVHFAEYVGLLAIFAGVFIIVFSTIRFFINRKNIARKDVVHFTGIYGTVFISIILLSVSLFVIFYVLHIFATKM